MSTINTYSATKSAVHSLTQGIRNELKDTNILVSAVYPGPIETDMTKKFSISNMETPENVAKEIVKGVEDGLEDIFPDPMSKVGSEVFMKDPKGLEKMYS